MANPVLFIKVLPDDAICLSLSASEGQYSPPVVKVRRHDLVYALLCGVGVRLTVPCQVMPQEDRDDPL